MATIKDLKETIINLPNDYIVDIAVDGTKITIPTDFYINNGVVTFGEYTGNICPKCSIPVFKTHTNILNYCPHCKDFISINNKDSISYILTKTLQNKKV